MKKILTTVIIICLAALLCGCSFFKSDYEKALDLMESGEYAKARELFLNDTENPDSPAKARECAFKIVTSYLDNELGGWDEYKKSFTQDDGDFDTYYVKVTSAGDGKIELIYTDSFDDSYSIFGNVIKTSTSISTSVALEHGSDVAECKYCAEISLNSKADTYESRGKLDISNVTKNSIGELTNVSGSVGQPEHFNSGIERSIAELENFLNKRGLGITMSDLGFVNYN